MNLTDFTSAVSGLANGNLTIALRSGQLRTFQGARFVGISTSQPETASFASNPPRTSTCHFIVEEVDFLIVETVAGRAGRTTRRSKKPS